MLKRTLFFGNPYHLSVKNKQLKVVDKNIGEEKTIPIEDVGFIVFEHPQITFSQIVIQLLAENNTAVIFCDAKHHPSSMLLHLDTHNLQGEQFRHQVQATEPLKKQLWKQTIIAKIKNQANLLDVMGRDGQALHYMATQVKSGDVGGVEAIAARKYWQRLFPVDFTRNRYGNAPNPALNYGYAILRAATARALAGSGLLATLGIHHHNRYNAFALADDIMEPYRPYVDLVVTDMIDEGLDTEVLNSPEKAWLLDLLTMDVKMNKTKRPLMVALSQTTASLSRCFRGEESKVNYPSLT